MFISTHSFNLRYISPKYSQCICRFHRILSFTYVWVIDICFLDPHPWRDPVIPLPYVPLLGEVCEPLLTHVHGMVPEVHARLLLLGEGGEPLIVYPVHHIHPDVGWLHIPA